jgi:hypothetical protein
VIENCAIATIDGPRHDQGGTEYRSGHVTVTGGRITAVGEGAAASVPAGAQRIDADGCLGTPPRGRRCGSGPAAEPAAWAGTTRQVHCGQACWPISRCGGSTASRTTRSRTALAATRSRP